MRPPTLLEIEALLDDDWSPEDIDAEFGMAPGHTARFLSGENGDQPERYTIPAYERHFGEKSRSRRLLDVLEAFREQEADSDVALNGRPGMSRPAPDSRRITWSFAAKAKRVAAAMAEQQGKSWWELSEWQRACYVELAIKVLEAVEAVEAYEARIKSLQGREIEP
jgi:hypothetical protein